jgi:hypothetical protein
MQYTNEEQKRAHKVKRKDKSKVNPVSCHEDKEGEQTIAIFCLQPPHQMWIGG